METAASAHTGILQQRRPDGGVIPGYELRGHPLRTRLRFRLVDSPFDRPSRGALTHLDRLTRLTGWQAQRLAEVRMVFQLHQQLAHHVTADELVIRGPTQR